MFFHTMTTKMKQMFDDYINGNLAAAKRRAKRYKFGKVYAAAQEIFSEKKAIAVTLYLKEPSQETFQKACDADWVCISKLPPDAICGVRIVALPVLPKA